MLKNFKLFLLSFVFAASIFTSCTNDEPLVEEQNTQESASITASLAALSLQYTPQGSLIASENPAGNIVFDFCFDFVYPLNLSYNNGTTVSINSLEELVSIIISSSNELYIDGIEFPFDVEAYNDDADAIEVISITNEEDFIDLLEDCDFDDVFDCDCTEEYSPVCVEVQAPTGEPFLITYPNACYAECDGFTAADFVEDCGSDYNYLGINDCFEFIFPLSIITDNNETVTVNSQEELANLLYNSYYYDFVFPFDITLTDDDDDDNSNNVQTINSIEDFIYVLEDCFDYDGNDDDCDCNDVFDPVCVQFEDDGEVFLVVFPNACYAECEGFTEDDFIECEDDNNPTDCTEEIISILMVECQFWNVDISGQTYTYVFGNDGTVEVSVNNDSIGAGTWSTSISPAGEVVVIINTASDNFSSDWTFLNCSPDNTIVVSSNAWMSNITSGCN